MKSRYLELELSTKIHLMHTVLCVFVLYCIDHNDLYSPGLLICLLAQRPLEGMVEYKIPLALRGECRYSSIQKVSVKQ